VPTEALMPIVSLRRLNLRHNGLRRVDEFAFRGLLHLEHLDIGDNHMPLAIHDDAFCGMVVVSDIADRVAPYGTPSSSSHSSSQNPNRKSSRTVVVADGGETDLHSSSSSSASINSGESSPIERTSGFADADGGGGSSVGLAVLKLDHNGLTTVSPCFMKSIRSTLRQVDLTGNPLICDCRLLDFVASSSPLSSDVRVAGGAQSMSITFAGAQCARPTHLAGLYLER
jgi:hypothetical protein